MGYDISQRADEHFAEASYTEAQRFISEAIMRLVTRYERRLSRKLTADEGQVLVHAKFEFDPQKVGPRFASCYYCDEWIDRGTLANRRYEDKDVCDYCQVPY